MSRKRGRTETLAAEPAPVLRATLSLSGGTPLPPKMIELWREGMVCDATITVQGEELRRIMVLISNGPPAMKSCSAYIHTELY